MTVIHFNRKLHKEPCVDSLILKKSNVFFLASDAMLDLSRLPGDKTST